jgi:hypothetical protein
LDLAVVTGACGRNQTARGAVPVRGLGRPARCVRETRGGDGIRTECTCCSVLA